MRLYAFLLLATALYAHAATIPVAQSEKKIIDVIPDDLDKTENVSSEQELIDQANTIQDIENKLRVKPEDIPVKVIVEDPQLLLKTQNENEESAEINRTAPDLKNPGLPQRQEHETQNPGYYANEQEAISKFKQSVNEAQNVLQQGFQGITDGIQSMLEKNEPIQTIQQSIQFLREGFIGQINKLNGTVQNFLQSESFVDQPAVKQTKAKFHEIEKGLKVLKNDFNTRVNTLADGVQVVAYLKAESENNPSSGSNPGFANPIVQYLQDMQQNAINSFQNLFGTNANEASSTTNPSAGALSDSPSSTGSGTSNNGWQWPSLPSWAGNWFTVFVPSQAQNPIQSIGSQIPGAGNPISGAGNPISGAGNPISSIGNQIPGIGNPASGVANPIQGLGNQFQGAGNPIQGIGNQFQSIGNPAEGAGSAQNTTGQSNSTSNPFIQGFQNNPFVQSIVNIIKPSSPASQAPPSSKPTEPTNSGETKPEGTTEGHSENKPEKPESHQENKPDKTESHQQSTDKPESHQASTEKPAADTQVTAITPVGPIRQMLQNNPIRKGIASAVQRIQNINNPEKPRDAEKTEEQNAEVVKKQDGDKPDSETKGHNGYGGNNSGDNNNNNSGIKQNEVLKEEIEKLPEAQKPNEDEVKEHKSEEVVDKSE